MSFRDLGCAVAHRGILRFRTRAFDPPGIARSALEVRNQCDAVGVQLATLVDRDIFAGYETFIREVKPYLVWHIGAGIVVEGPAAALPMNEMTVVVPFVRPRSDMPRDARATASGRSGRRYRAARR